PPPRLGDGVEDVGSRGRTWHAHIIFPCGNMSSPRQPWTESIFQTRSATCRTPDPAVPGQNYPQQASLLPLPAKTPKKAAKVPKKAAAKRVAAKPTLLAGGNPQIAKADGDGGKATLRRAK